MTDLISKIEALRGNRSTPLWEAKDRTVPEITVFIDTETESVIEAENQEIHRLVLGCYEVWHNDGLGYAIRLLDDGTFRTEGEFFRLIRSVLPCRVVAHNWNFDASALRIGYRPNMEAFEYDIDFSRSIVGSNGMYAPFLLTLDFGDMGNAELVCSTNFFKVSLAVLGDTFGSNKLEMPDKEVYDDIPKWLEALERYCIQDVAILRKAWFSLWDVVKSLGSVNPGITIAETSMRVFLSKYKPDVFVQGSKGLPMVEQAEAEGYRGGRTDTFFKGKASGRNLFKYDVNSLYPSVMMNPVPIRYRQPTTLGTFYKRTKRGFLGRELHLIDATINIEESNKYSFIGLEGIPVEDRGLVFGIGRYRTWLWQPMFHRAYTNGMVEDVHAVYCYDSAPIFADFVSDIYSKRIEHKISGDKASDALLKYLLNSLYGKFGQRENTKWELVEGEEKGIMARDDGTIRWSDTYQLGVEREYIQLGNKLWGKDPDLKGAYKRSSVLSIAGYITSMARCVLWDALKVVIDKGGNVYMCDTDSIVCDVPLPQDVVDSTGLGMWGLEDELDGDDVFFRSPKDYVWGADVKMKGIRDPIAGKSTYRQTQFPRFMTDLNSKQPLRRQRLDAGAVLTHIIKTAGGVNLKRHEMGEGQATLPIVLDL